MKMTVVGHFDLKSGIMIGASVKVRELYNELKELFPNDEVEMVDIYNWKKYPLRMILNLVNSFCYSKHIILVISDTSSLLMFFFATMKKIFDNRLWYIAVGGNMGTNLEKNRIPPKKLRCIDAFFVENIDCIKDMNRLGYSNVYLLRNFKRLTPIRKEEINIISQEYKFCTFSRVVEEKGISDAIKAIEVVREEYPEKKILLDIYGPIDSGYKERFEELINKSEGSSYCGVIDSDKSVDILKKYYCMLFPTKFQTEGIPGTIIDAFASGLPVLCAEWQRCRQLIHNYYDGIIYPFDDFSGLVSAIKYAVNNPKIIFKMKENCLESYAIYEPDNAIKPLVKCIVKKGENE